MSSSPSSSSPSHARWPLLVCALVIGALGGAFAGFQYAHRSSASNMPDVTYTIEQLAAQNAAVHQSQTESRFLRAQLDAVDGEMVVERAARQELEVQLRAAQDELGQVRERLAFFEQLLPPGPAGAVDIRGAEIIREGQGLKYRILLMRNSASDSSFEGSLRFQASGMLGGEDISVDLLPMQLSTDDASGAVATTAATNPLSLRFEKYQRSEGVLSLPEGFVPETVVVSVLEGNTVRASRTVRLAF